MHKALTNQLQKEIRRTSRSNWRRFVYDLISNQSKAHNKGLWTLSRWSQKCAGTPQDDPHLPDLRKSPDSPLTVDNEEKTKILAGRFFLTIGNTDISDIAAEEPPERRLIDINPNISPKEICELIRKLPNNKAPGPDEIPNEILKVAVPAMAQSMAKASSQYLAAGTIPQRLKESITIVLYKEGKKDYSLPSSYRPIALENSLAKVLEKRVANVMTEAAESHNLLPWNQMGARKKRSTLSVVDLLSFCVETAWKAQRGCVVSMLSLDLAGAFDNVSHGRLLHILH